MKKKLIIFLITMSLFYSEGYSQALPPNESGSGHSQNGNQPPGGGAPIGGGLVILLSLSTLHMGKRIFFTSPSIDVNYPKP